MSALVRISSIDVACPLLTWRWSHGDPGEGATDDDEVQSVVTERQRLAPTLL
jgi:hypothetical protein